MPGQSTIFDGDRAILTLLGTRAGSYPVIRGGCKAEEVLFQSYDYFEKIYDRRSRRPEHPGRRVATCGLALAGSGLKTIIILIVR